MVKASLQSIAEAKVAKAASKVKLSIPVKAKKPNPDVLSVPAVECFACLQDTHSVDTHMPTPAYVEWLRYVKHSDGKFHPSGKICKKCDYVLNSSLFVAIHEVGP